MIIKLWEQTNVPGHAGNVVNIKPPNSGGKTTIGVLKRNDGVVGENERSRAAGMW